MQREYKLKRELGVKVRVKKKRRKKTVAENEIKRGIMKY